MKIELRKVKHSPSLSQETNAYTADVWVDGVKRGTVRNDGSGGPDHVEPAALAREVADHVNTLPDVQFRGHFLKMSTDLLLGDLLKRHLDGKQLQRLMKKNIVFIKNGRAYTLPGYTKPLEKDLKILNDLPFEEALKAFMEGMEAP